MTRPTIFAPGEFYHIYNRGTEKRKIFNNNHDYERFLALLYLANSSQRVDMKLQGSTLLELLSAERESTLVEICAFCLMPNHFHLILQEKEEGGISKFMQKLVTGYTMYFNKLNERSGSLLQGRFKAEHADNDKYLSYLIAYIHLNPIKLIEPSWNEVGIKDEKRAKNYLDSYSYSSFIDYSGKKRGLGKILSMDALPGYSTTFTEFRKIVFEWILQG